jgi:2-dehydropantoate 2-reductase
MSWDFKSAAVVGSGAIGLYYGGRLAEAGADVRFLARSDYEALTQDGLRAESMAGDFHLPQVSAFRSPGEIGPVDLVIVAWKATANDAFAEVLPPLLHDQTQVLTLQNGLGNCERIAEIVGPERVTGGLCFVCINRTGPGVVSHTSGGRLTIGEFGAGLPGRAEALAARFQAAKIPASAVDDLEKAQWEKLIWNIPFNGLAVAEGGVTTQQLLADPAIENQIRELMFEVVAAARGQGIFLEESLVEKNIGRTREMDAYRPSTMIDFIEGRELELGPIWEEPLRRAREAGVPTPALERLLQRIREKLKKRDAL